LDSERDRRARRAPRQSGKAGYGLTRSPTDRLLFSSPLEETLNEEKHAGEILNKIAMQPVNRKAA
jgi:hypothetical protein